MTSREPERPAAASAPPTSVRVVWAARLLVLGILGIAAYGYWEGTPQDVVNAVRSGNVEGLKSALARDAAAVHTRVYAQAYETSKARSDYRARTGRDPWDGRYLVHDAVQVSSNAIAILDVLAAGGADLNVRLKGKTLLHLAAETGDIDVATWLLEHGADLQAGIDCDDGCAERGYTPLHSGLEFRDEEMTELLLFRGAMLEATGADGRTALHAAAARGKLSGAFVLARHGADLARTDAAGKTPFDLAGRPTPGATQDPAKLAEFAAWFKPGGKFDTVSALARKSGSSYGDEAARRVFDEIDAKAR